MNDSTLEIENEELKKQLQIAMDMIEELKSERNRMESAIQEMYSNYEYFD